MVSFYFAVWSFSQRFNLILLSGIYPTIREFGVPSVMLEATNMICFFSSKHRVRGILFISQNIPYLYTIPDHGSRIMSKDPTSAVSP